MIFADFEATGLLAPDAAPITQQPYAFEFAMVKVDAKLKVVARFESWIKPPLPIPDEASKITGVTDAMVAGAPSFAAVYPKIAAFVLGEDTFVAHNAPYDLGVLRYELIRIGRQFAFPWPPKQICTVEAAGELKGLPSRSLPKLYEFAFGKPPTTSHRAMADVDTLIEVAKWLRKNGVF